MESAYDTEKKLFISARQYNDDIFKFFDLQDLRADSRSHQRYVCVNPECQRPVSLCANHCKDSDMPYYFRHKDPDAHDCFLHSKHPGNRASAHNGVQEGKRHLNTKTQIASLLSQLPDWQVVDVDRKMIFSDDGSERRKPDIHARYRGQDIVIEVQFHSENPLVIRGRQRFYADKGWPMLYISINSPDKEEHSELDVPIRQVHKDIAGIQNGNWFQFSTDTFKSSAEAKEFILDATYLDVWCDDNRVAWMWRKQRCSYSDLTAIPGQTYLVDSKAVMDSAYQRFSELQATVGVAVGTSLLSRAEQPNPEYTLRTYDDYKDALEREWTHYPEYFSDSEHSDLFHESFGRRQRKLAATILKCAALHFVEDNQRYKEAREKFSELAEKVEGLGFGIGKHTSLETIAHLLCIMGSPLYSGDRDPYAVATASIGHIANSKPGSDLYGGMNALPLAIEASQLSERLTISNAVTRKQTLLNNIRLIKPTGIHKQYCDFISWWAEYG